MQLSKSKRLYFIDALRAFAILMMLQGHFISGLLLPELKASTEPLYRFWLYCRGFTAPVFFTITGWIFTYLLMKNTVQGKQNPRLKKGLQRMLELLFWGYLLRLNLPMLFKGKINPSFLMPDVLQIIGLSLGVIVICYLLFISLKKKIGLLFILFGTLIFLTEPLYVDASFTDLPKFISAYFTKANGGVFYLFPWLGYVFFGGGIACVFNAQTRQLSRWAIGSVILGTGLIFYSSTLLIHLFDTTGIELFKSVAYNNFLFIRLGDVFVLFGVFMLLNPFFKNGFWVRVGQETLSLYIVHYFILYGSLFGVGIYKFYKYSFTFTEAIVGALLFIGVCLGVVFTYPLVQREMRKLKNR